MAQDNLELVRSSIAAFNRRDLDSLLSVLHDDVEYDVTEVLFTGPHRGKEDVRNLLVGLWGLLDDMWMESERIEELDDGRVVVVVHQGGRGHGSGVQVEARRCHVMTLREGKVSRVKVHADPTEALRAVGIRE